MLRFGRSVGLLAGTALAVSGCGMFGPVQAGGATSSSASAVPFDAASPTQGSAVTRHTSLQGVDLTVTVGPALRQAERLVVPVNVVGRGDKTVDLAPHWTAPNSQGVTGAAVVDFTTGQLYPATALATEKLPVGGESSEPAVAHLATAAVAGPQLSVLLPGIGMVHNVPVLDTEIPSALAAELDKLGARFPATPHALNVSLTETSSGLRISQTDAGVTAVLPTDDLFVPDSPDLTYTAHDALADLATYVAPLSGGTIQVTGHSDGVGEAADNLALSQARAEAVAGALQEQLAGAGFEFSASGQGANQPLVPEVDAAANRRVEVTITADVEGALVPPSAGEEVPVPARNELVGQGPIEVVDSENQEAVRIAVNSLQRHGDFLVGEFLVTATGESHTRSAADWLGLSNDNRETVAVLDGQLRLAPVTFTEDGAQVPLADLGSTEPLPEDETVAVTVVWPAVDAETVTLDVAATEEGSEGWRLTDVATD
ncbi:OmpA family protein [Buchananella hordeovulneris]|uniref:OmpA-like domain-containing protein n=1 Tax=Buchananella hordeovulneris TaxID=52770 RepID=A0A1Q5PVD7_9ACTO|nr:OmpA family protein [Buchananella hordeovulneris]OKL51554.1 hypothetical protein BSZ40_06830 [Buchananella hordeovulneris]